MDGTAIIPALPIFRVTGLGGALRKVHSRHSFVSGRNWARYGRMRWPGQSSGAAWPDAKC